MNLEKSDLCEEEKTTRVTEEKKTFEESTVNENIVKASFDDY